MIHIDFDPATLTGTRHEEWREWLEAADKATKDVIRQWKEWLAEKRENPFDPKLDGDVWSTLKAWLLEEYFHGKCAYCETHVTRFDYHAEHFRPKGAVTFRAKDKKKLQKAKCTDDKGAEVSHPGYFWLAYSWRNLLPSCGFCNTSKGKKTQFPVKTIHVGPYVPAGVGLPNEDTLDTAEGPLLLHPVRDDPRKHLVFGVAGEIVAYEDSEKGANSIKVFDLDAEELRIDRQKAQEQARVNFLVELSAAKGALDAVLTAGDAFIAQVETGKDEYSAAVVDYLREFRRKLAGT